MKDYLVKNEKVSSKLYKVTFGGENWDGLVKALQSSSMKEKETFLNIIKNTTDDAKRKQEIMRVGGGAPYRTMLKEIYPRLRKVNWAKLTTPLSISMLNKAASLSGKIRNILV